MEIYHIADVISLLGLPAPSAGRSSYNVQCPCCDENPRKKHMNINLKKDVFRCPRCGVNGGIFDLYSLYTGVPRDKAKQDMAERLGTSVPIRRKKQEPPPVPVVEECPITDVETRHATYSALLAKLSLASDHRHNLLNRGLSERDIEGLGYRTTPAVGASAIAKQLLGDGCYLAGVPGFYRDEAGVWTFVHDNRGILVPVRDKDGLIQGLQVRLDHVEKRKYRWISSADRKDGCKAEGWTHLAGPVQKEIILTEGPMKADVVHALSGHTVLAVPGVNALTQLRPTLEALHTSGVEVIYTAFDMDFFTNAYVQSGYDKLLTLLEETGFQYGTYLWDPRYKGLDDYIWEAMLSRTLPIQEKQ